MAVCEPREPALAHVAVDDLQQAIAFYSALFAAEPSVTKLDYAKWRRSARQLHHLDVPAIQRVLSLPRGSFVAGIGPMAEGA
jgi:hypothetical protein